MKGLPRGRQLLKLRRQLLNYAAPGTKNRCGRERNAGSRQHPPGHERKIQLRREITMRIVKLATVFLIPAGAFAGLADKLHVRVLPVAKASEGCSVKTIQGSYGGVLTALSLPGAPPVPTATPQAITAFQPFQVLELINFDGAGKFQTTITASQGGTLAQTFPDSGPYTVNSNCTGSLAAGGGLFTFDFIIFHQGKEIRFIETDGTGVVASTWTRM